MGSINMRKNLLLTIVFCTTILAAFVTIVIAGRMYDQNGLLFGGKTAEFAEGWKTADGNNVVLPGDLPSDNDGMVRISNTLPSTLQDDSVLFLRTTYLSADVYIDGNNIYSWNIQNSALFIRSFGLSSHIINVPASAAGKSIELRLFSNQQGGSVSIYGLTLGDGITTTVSLINQNIDTIVLFFVLSVLFVLVFTSSIVFRKRIPGQSPADALYLSAFIALSAVWMITDSNVLLLFSVNVVITLYTSLFSLMLLPVPLLLFLRRFTHNGKSIINLLAALVMLNFFICLGLLLFGIADLIQTLITSHILELVVCISIMTLFIIEFIKYKRRDIIEVIIGLSLLGLLGISSNIVFSIGGNPGGSFIFHIGLALFVLSLGIGVIRRGINALARSKSYEKLTLSIPSGICRIENFETGRIIFANEFYYRMYGYTEEEALKVGFTSSHFTVLPEDLAAMLENKTKDSAVRVTQFSTESRHIKKDGEIIWILSRHKVDRHNRGEITLVMIDITDRRQIEEKLRISEEEYRIATRHSNKHIIRLDVRIKTAYFPSDAPTVFGPFSYIENVPDSIIATGTLAQDSIDAFKSFYAAIYEGVREGSVVVSVYDKTANEYKWYRHDFTSIFDDSNKPVQAIITFYDVTLQRQKELAFQRWQQSYNSIPKNATNYYEYNLTADLFEHAEGEMIPPIPDDIPRQLEDVTSYIAKHYVFRDDIKVWLEFMSRDRLQKRYASGLHTDKVEFRRLINDNTMWTSLSLQLIPDPFSSDVKGYFLLEDIDEQKKAEIYLQERSTLDSLTGLLNRGAFVEKFNDILSRSSPDTQHALIMLDIDNFKTINDTLGHNAGDALLVHIAGKIKYALRSDDLCGRIGGDEFVICLKNMNLGKSLEARVSDLCSLVCDEHTWGTPISASFGISGFPYDGQTFDELYQKADIALYKAKAKGRGGFAVYDPQLSFDDLSVTIRHA